MSESSDHESSGRGEDPSGGPAGPGDHPSLGSPEWRLVPQRPDWDEAYLAAMADDEYPGDLESYEDPDNAPPPGLDDDQLAALIAEAREITAEQARAAEVAARLGHTAVLAAIGAWRPGGGARGCPARRRLTRASTPAGRPGSPPASRWISRPAAPPWPRSWRTPPGTMTGTPARPMTSCSG